MDWGVLGFQTPSLQIFYPIDSRTMILLIDDQVYGGRYREPFLVDVHSRCDVSQLNALQLHHGLNAVYFADARHQEYVQELWNAHKSSITKPESLFQHLKGWLVDGEPVENFTRRSSPTSTSGFPASSSSAHRFIRRNTVFAVEVPNYLNSKSRRDPGAENADSLKQFGSFLNATPA